ncbi:MAG: hypothetical protein KUG81_06450 [Gammaproteobacteria bacterium]|nr:hypothetical protein [Gammaproteobacteria bacterium]
MFRFFCKKICPPIALIAFIAVLCVLPWNSSYKKSTAQIVDILVCSGIPCAAPNDTQTALNGIFPTFVSDLTQAECDIKQDAATAVDDMMEALLTELHDTERDIIDWWESWWWYDMRPSMQDMTGQLDTAHVDQARTIGSFFDAEEQHKTQYVLQEKELLAHRDYRPSEQVCVAGTQSGGFGGSYAIMRHMRDAREREMNAVGMQTTGTQGEYGNGRLLQQKWTDYVANFCDVNSNSGATPGVSGCTATGLLPNADIKVAATLLNAKTIDIRTTNATTTARRVALRRMVDNLVEPNISEPFQPSVMVTSVGRQAVLQRRSLMARRAVARSIPEYIASSRLPGSRVGTWVTELRQNAGIASAVISDNPSYREVMHAISVEKFTNGRYALSMIDDTAQLKQEKIVLSSLYLMQLRDYYELLERMALSLAVQVSIMADEVPPMTAVPSRF